MVADLELRMLCDPGPLNRWSHLTSLAAYTRWDPIEHYIHVLGFEDNRVRGHWVLAGSLRGVGLTEIPPRVSDFGAQLHHCV